MRDIKDKYYLEPINMGLSLIEGLPSFITHMNTYMVNGVCVLYMKGVLTRRGIRDNYRSISILIEPEGNSIPKFLMIRELWWGRYKDDTSYDDWSEEELIKLLVYKSRDITDWDSPSTYIPIGYEGGKLLNQFPFDDTSKNVYLISMNGIHYLKFSFLNISYYVSLNAEPTFQDFLVNKAVEAGVYRPGTTHPDRGYYILSDYMNRTRGYDLETREWLGDEYKNHIKSINPDWIYSE